MHLRMTGNLLLRGVPRLNDVRTMQALLVQMGVAAEQADDAVTLALKYAGIDFTSIYDEQVEQGIEPEMRKVEVHGAPVNYVNAGFAPAYWGGYGFGPGIFTGFLLGEALAATHQCTAPASAIPG